ncbi:MAG: hypothetical protein WBB23_13730 [Desulforhopalus sp.]
MGNSLPARYYTLQAGKKIIIVALMINKLFLQEHEYGIKKGKENIKNGNKCLVWRLSEAAELSKRYSESTKTFSNRKSAKTTV